MAQSTKETKEPLKMKKKSRAKNLGKASTSNNITKVDLEAEKRQVDLDNAPTKVIVKSETKEEVKETSPVLEEIIEKQEDPMNCYVKGDRKGRPIFDQIFTLGMSFFETIYLRTKLWDINAQPNIFHRSFLFC